MAYISQVGSFAPNLVLTASNVNQTEVNIRDHVHGQDGVVGIGVTFTNNASLVNVSHGTSASVASISVTAGALGTNGGIVTRLFFTVLSASGIYSHEIRMGAYFGATLVASMRILDTTFNKNYHFDLITFNINSTGHQKTYATMTHPGCMSGDVLSTDSTEDSTSALPYSLFFDIRSHDSNDLLIQKTYAMFKI
jgi:hypothetical protein